MDKIIPIINISSTIDRYLGRESKLIREKGLNFDLGIETLYSDGSLRNEMVNGLVLINGVYELSRDKNTVEFVWEKRIGSNIYEKEYLHNINGQRYLGHMSRDGSQIIPENLKFPYYTIKGLYDKTNTNSVDDKIDLLEKLLVLDDDFARKILYGISLEKKLNLEELEKLYENSVFIGISPEEYKSRMVFSEKMERIQNQLGIYPM